jgi:hypothetical protein
MLLNVDFGAGYEGLSSVGYRVVDPAGVVAIPRTSAGVIDLGQGKYAADIAVSQGFVGSIVWDIAPDSDISALGTVNERLEAPPTAYEIVDAWFDRPSAIDGLTPRQALQVIAAACAGVCFGAGGAQITFKAVDGSSNRIVATVDADGNRSVVILNV